MSHVIPIRPAPKKQSVFNCYLRKIRVERQDRVSQKGGVDKQWTTEPGSSLRTCAATQCNDVDWRREVHFDISALLEG